MTKSQPTVGIVTVTYGDRSASLREVLSAIRALQNSEQVTQVIVVDNNSSSDTTGYLDELAMIEPRLQVIRRDSNTGSAAAFATGLRAVTDAACEFVWLLDDDNVPAIDALSELLISYETLSCGNPVEMVALLSLRRDHAFLARVASGEDPRRVFPKPSSFLGFHLADVPRKLAKILGLHKGMVGGGTFRPTLQGIPYGPYGGLFLRTNVLARLGYPDDRFFLYADDFEYTSRLARSGGKLLLAPASQISDIDDSWHVKNTGSAFVKYFSEPSDGRIYYSLRNQAYFERQAGSSNKTMYRLNELVFRALLKLVALVRHDPARLELIRAALQDGKDGRLGKVEHITI